MSFDDVLRMPIRTFWSYAKNITRLKAEEDLRAMDVIFSGQSAEFAKQHRSDLIEAVGRPVIGPPKPVDHKAGINKLKQLLGV